MSIKSKLVLVKGSCLYINIYTQGPISIERKKKEDSCVIEKI